jgi:hypothetical protein
VNERTGRRWTSESTSKERTDPVREEERQRTDDGVMEEEIKNWGITWFYMKGARAASSLSRKFVTYMCVVAVCALGGISRYRSSQGTWEIV